METVKGWKIGLAALLLALPLLTGAARAQNAPPGASEPLISPDEMLSVDQVKPGMQGYGRSVFQGTKIERFNVTVLSVLRKMDYDGDMILIRIDDGFPVTSGSGVSAGMSGSPIYVDGKLIGALAFAWPFAKNPVAGVTPIAQMLEVYQPGSAPKPRPVARTGDLTPRDGPLKLEGQFFANARVVPDRGLAASAKGTMYLTPVATPVMCSGMGRHGVDALQRTLGRYSTMVMQGPGAPDLPASERPKIEPGSAIGVQLLGGDVDSTAIGTVTYVKRDHVLAFGHPMFGLGSIDMPMTTAYIHGIIASQEVSFKMGSAIEPVGHITQDRNWSIGGRMGQPARSVDAQFLVEDADRGVRRDYHVRAAVQRDVTPALIYSSLMSAVGSVSPAQSGATRGTIEVWPHGMAPIKRENIFSQSEKPSQLEQLFGDPFASMPLAELLQIMSTLEVNSFGSVPVDRVKVTVSVSEKRSTAAIERAYADRKRVRPGDTVKLGVVLQPADGPKRTEEFELKIPTNIPAGKLQIGVAGGSSAERVRQAMMIAKPQAKSLAQLLQQLSDREQNNDLTIEIAQPVAGVAVSGYEFPNLPNVVVEVLTGSNASGVKMTRSHLRQTRAMPWALSGAALLSLDVEADEKDKAGTLPAMLPALGIGGMGSLLDLFKMGAGGEAGGLAAGGDDDGGQLAGGEASAETRALRTLLRMAARAGKPGGETAPNDAKMPSFEELQKILSGESSTGGEGSGGEGGEATPVKSGVARAPGVWKMNTAADFQSGKLDGTLISSRGELALAPQAATLLSSPDRFYWAQTATRSGVVYVGGWLNGEIGRVQPDGAISKFYDASPEVAISALAHDEDGVVYAAAEPSGNLLKITPDGKATVFCTLKGERVWALRKSGANLYAGTGSDGRLYEITPDGKATVLFTAPDRHILALADDGKGTLFCGTYPRGKVFRIRDGKATPLYESPSLTVTALAADGAGNVYVGTSPRATVIKVDPTGAATTLFASNKEKHVFSMLLDADGSVVAGVGAPARVYRIAADQTVSTLWDPKAADVLSLSRDGSGSIFATTAGPTQIVRLGAAPALNGSYTSPVLNAKALSRWGAVRWNGPEQGVEIQTRSGNTSYPDATWSEWSQPYRKAAGEAVTSPAGQYLQYRVALSGAAGKPSPVVRNVQLFYRTRNRAPEVKLQSPAAGELFSGTKVIRWTAKDPDGDRLTYDIYAAREGTDKWVKIGTRTGKTQGEAGQEKDGSEDATALLTAVSARPEAAGPRLAAGRPAGHAPAAVSTRPAHAPVALARAAKTQPAVSGSPTKPAPAAKKENADASDTTVLEAAVEGMEGSGSINWSTRGLPDGRYRIKVVTTDALTSPDEPATVEVISEPVQVINTPPVIQVAKALREGPAPPREIPVSDAGAYVASAEYRVDGGEWIGAAAGDGIFDSAEETIRIDAQRLAAGKHTLEVRARNAAGCETTVKVPYVIASPATVKH